MSTEKSLGIGCLPLCNIETSNTGESCIAKDKVIKALEKKSIKNERYPLIKTHGLAKSSKLLQ